jgi:PhnB protein
MKINPYLNFDGKAEEAFLFYQSIFGGEFLVGIRYFHSMEGMDQLSESERNRVMHVKWEIGTDLLIMAGDTLPSAGHIWKPDNHNYISLNLDSIEEGEDLFQALSDQGNIEMEYQKTFWGAYFRCFEDRFGIDWMINYYLNNGKE